MTLTADNAQLDQLWVRYAELKPKLLTHVKIVLQEYRKRHWYVLHNSLNGKNIRINAVAYNFVSRLRGQETVAAIVQSLNNSPDSNVSFSEQDATLLLLQLQHQGGLLDGVEINARQLLSIRQLEKKKLLQSRLFAPLAVRIPLFDPDASLDRCYPLVSKLFSRWAAVTYAVLVLCAILASYLHWEDIKREFFSIGLTPRFLFLMWLVFPVMKLVHEFSHAIMVKRNGGEVHEMGMSLLVFTPVPYVDASAAWLIRSRAQRIMVSAVGIVAELLVASVALIFWMLTESGLLKEIAFAMVVVGSVSTVAFNANPLLKFDGYYVLQDWLEMPNLFQRSQQYLIYLCKRVVLGVSKPLSPVLAEGERKWFIFFGIASLIYRNVILLVIAIWLLDKLLIVGLILLFWVVCVQYVLPFYRGLRYLFTSPELGPKRWPRLAAPATGIVLIALFLTLVPFPHSTPVAGIVWVPEQAQLYTSGAGQVTKIFAEAGELLERNDPVLQLSNPELETRVAVLDAQIAALRIKFNAEVVDSTTRVVAVDDDLAALEAERDLAQLQLNALTLRAPVDGRFTSAVSGNLLGRYFGQGQLIGHVIDPSKLVIKAALPEHKIGAFESQVQESTVRLAENLKSPLPAVLTHQTPSANQRLPSAALGSGAGGGIAIATGNEDDGTRTVERVFHFEMSLVEPTAVKGIGGRAYVNVKHPPTPLAQRIVKSTRQLFLRHLPDYAG